jgi:ribosomal protein S18 acetylase RimI-like enzyme
MPPIAVRGSVADRADVEVRPFSEADRTAVVALWARAHLTRPWNDPNRDIDRKLAIDPDGLLVGIVDDRVVATAMAGYDGHRGWVNYLAVDPDLRGNGLGALMMAAAIRLLEDRGCPKVNVQVRTDHAGAVDFYRAIGFEPDDVVSLGLRLVDDRPADRSG